MSERLKLTCVIPTLNAGNGLSATLTALLGEALSAVSVLVVDGGSQDDTLELASSFGATVISARGGRGPQLAAGARAALQGGAEWLLFLHADTVLEENWLAETTAFAVAENIDKAAVFTFALDDTSASATRMEKLVAWRTKVLALPYGDQGLLISKSLYLRIGGFRELELMEDVDMVRRIGADRLVCLQAKAVTSAAKFKLSGYVRRSLRNLFCLGLFFARVPVRWIARIYG